MLAPLAPRHRRASTLALSLGLALGVSALLSAVPRSACAQAFPAGQLSGHFLATPDDEIGGLLGADLWVPFDLFRIGGFLGVGALPSVEDARNRTFMPLGLSIALELLDRESVGLSLRARGGLWGGATQAEKITVGPMVGGGAHLLISLGGGAALTVGLDVMGLLGPGASVVFAPGVGLSWDPTPEPASDE